MVPSDGAPAQSCSPCTATRGRPGAGEGVAGLRSSLDTTLLAYEPPSQAPDLVHGPCLSGQPPCLLQVFPIYPEAP